MPLTRMVEMRVIIADDYDDTAELLALLLESSSPHRTSVAKNGEEALRLALDCRPDVVLLDIDMPKMSGLDVARAIRAFYGVNRPTLIGISGRHDISVISKDGAFDHVLQKPVDVADLLPLIGM